jgi:hypothetical protein
MLTRSVSLVVIVSVGCIAALLYVGFVPLGLPGRIRSLFDRRIPEAGRYDLKYVNDFVARLGAEGVSIYRRQLLWDIPFAILWGLTLAFLVFHAWTPVWAQSSRLPYLMAFIPVFYLVFDLAEDVTLLIAIRPSNLCLPPRAPYLVTDPNLSGPLRGIQCPVCHRSVVTRVREGIAHVEERVEEILRGGDATVEAPATVIVPHLLNGSQIAGAEVFTTLKFIFASIALLSLPTGIAFSIGVWHG